jgi:two-component system sensor histidine kinase SenX3
LPILHNLKRESKTYLSRRFWILGALLLVLCALALVQYRWIDQIAEAQRQRAQENLTAALSDVESDFDIEITRAFVAFQIPFANLEYSERYREWLQHAPYPRLIRGVYIAEARQTASLPKPVIPGEPLIRSNEWQRDLSDLRPPLAGVTTFASVSGQIGLQTFSTGVAGGEFVSRNPEVMIDGNPAFVFPIMPTEPGVATLLTRTQGAESPLRREGIVSVGGPARLPKWGVIVLDADYMRTTFLPSLVNLHFRNSAASDYEILVVNRNSAISSRSVFPSNSAPPENQFAHPDGRINLFELRLDCFSPSSSANAISIIGTSPNVRVLSIDNLSEILARKPLACNTSPSTSADASGGLWKMLVRYRAGSLDQAMATFRRRNLLLSGSVLVVLALGICMLVVLTERARSLAEMQTEFVLGVSHELRTPLTVIRVAADNLKRGIVESSEQAHKYGEIIDNHASELSNMIEETLEFARMQSTAVIGKRTPVAPGNIVKASLANCEPALHNAGIDVELHLAPDLPLMNVDIHLMNRCLENLIHNIVKYAAAGRWMAIRANKVTRPDGHQVQISVEDRGPGISPVDLPHIFEPFYRGKHAESSQVPGVGLGLTLVKRVVEAHHGTVEVESSESAGTMFSIFLHPHRAEPGTQKVA